MVVLKSCQWVHKISTIIFQSINECQESDTFIPVTNKSVLASCYLQRNLQGNLKQLEKTMENVVQIFRQIN